MDEPGVRGLQVGDHNVQFNYHYRGTWSDGVAPPPLIAVSGEVDSPYRGLGTFTERDAGFFFGRDAAVEDVLGLLARRAAEPSILMVTGVSGAGKSSLIRAGVLPRIRGAGLSGAPESHAWPFVIITPGRAPLDELALRTAQSGGLDAATVRRELRADPESFALTAAQAAGDRRLLLVIDQFEQLFTHCESDSERRVFLDALCAAGSGERAPALVVVIVRADVEARCGDYEQLTDALQHRYFLTGMTERQLRLVITEPAVRTGSHVDDALVELLLREINARTTAVDVHEVPQPGAGSAAGVLPLLSHALDQAWRSRAGDELTIGDYERTGGIERAVADSAQRAYDGLTSGQQLVARQVFVRLTATGADGLDTASRVARTELTADVGCTSRVARTESTATADPDQTDDVTAVLEAFTAERLLTLGADTVEIAHEVLLTAWPLLRDEWLAETRADRIVRTRLRATATEWEREQHDPSYLYTGSILETATATAERVTVDSSRHPPLSPAERDFLNASSRAAMRRTRRVRGVIALLVVMVLVLGTTTVFAILANGNATRQRDAAVADQLTIESANTGDSDPELARQESLAAWRIHPTDETRYAMLNAAALPGIAVLRGRTVPVESLVFGPGGKTIAVADNDGSVQLWDTATRRPLGAPFTAPDLPPTPEGVSQYSKVDLSPDGRTVAVGTIGGKVRLWDTATHNELGVAITDGGLPIDAMAFSPDGRTVVVGDDAGAVRFWDTATRKEIGPPLAGLTGSVDAVTFSPDGRTIVTNSRDGLRLWDTATHSQLGAAITFDRAVNLLAFRPDGTTLAVGDGHEVRLIDLATREVIGTPFDGHTDTVLAAAFSPDSRTLATVSADHTLRVWDVLTHTEIGAPLTGHTDTVESLTFAPDGKVLATGSSDGTVRLWNVGFGTVVGGDTSGAPAALSPDGRILAVPDLDAVHLWDVTTGREVGSPLPVDDFDGELMFSSDGKILATDSTTGAARLWDMATHREIDFPFSGRDESVMALALSPDGRTLATTDPDGGKQFWDIKSRQPIGSRLASADTIGLTINSMTFSPDGKTLATNGFAVRLWDTATRRETGEAITNDGVSVRAMAFSPDNKTLATADDGHLVRLWSVATHKEIGPPMAGHSESVLAVTFSPDGKTLATGGRDDTVRLWDVATHRPIPNPLLQTGGDVHSVEFTPDGKTLATGSDKAQLWGVGYLADPAARLCADLDGESLTRSEWAKYAQGPSYRKTCP